MALVNEVLVGRPNAILHKLLNMKEGAPSPQLSPDLQAVLVLENDRPEFKFLGGETLGMGFGDAAAGAANYSHVGLINPVGSGVLVVVERVLLALTAAGSIGQIGLQAIGATAWSTAHAYMRDTRGYPASGSGQTSALTGTFVGADLGAAHGYLWQQPLGANRIDLDMVLSPGFVALVRPGTVNQRCVATWFFRERPIELSETR